MQATPSGSPATAEQADVYFVEAGVVEFPIKLQCDYRNIGYFDISLHQQQIGQLVAKI